VEYGGGFSNPKYALFTDATLPVPADSASAGVPSPKVA
jgi:hypothetical protein